MQEIQSPQRSSSARQELLYFWAIGDLHYRARDQWHALHARRLAPLFQDLRTLWRDEGFPAFCVAPGDIVDTGAAENYMLAKRDLAAQLGNIPFYPGIGNHEYHADSRHDSAHTAAEFTAVWERPIRYTWQAGEVTCIMLDQPDPYMRNPADESPTVILSHESLTFLEAALAQRPGCPAVIFAHCPLRDTVLDRDPERNLDDDSLDPFFYIENSREVRAILARHRNACLFISGHTHSGWGSPNLICTERLDSHAVTYLNLMSPWYTGAGRGPRLNADRSMLEYHPDDPDVLASFGIHIYRQHIVIRVRDHRARKWLARWEVPLIGEKAV